MEREKWWLHWGALADTALTTWSRSMSWAMSWCHAPADMWWEWHLTLLMFLPKPSILVWHRKFRETQIEGLPLKYLTKTFKVYIVQKSSKKIFDLKIWTEIPVIALMSATLMKILMSFLMIKVIPAHCRKFRI